MVRKILRITFIILVGVFVIIQFIPSHLPDNNPPEGYNFFTANEVPPGVETLLRNACFDCHSQETTYPWYSKVAPVSWLLARDVRHGRHHLDFSNWSSLEKRKKLNVLDDISDEVKGGDMPLEIYVPMHPSARLTDADRKMIIDWADGLAEKVFNE